MYNARNKQILWDYYNKAWNNAVREKPFDKIEPLK